jgi:acetoin utilization deacetylase AcuC-like enzyme
VGGVRLLLSTHERFADHDTGTGHPERPARLRAVLAGIEAAGVPDALTWVSPRPATRAELELTHPAAYVDAIERFCAAGGGNIDADTAAGPASWSAAVLAAGAGVDAVDRLDAGEADAAFCVVRPPGHHAEVDRAMGFCLINNVAVTASALAARGERVVIVDWDAHHGNGTQACFWDDPRVLYVSLHEFPLYPFSGRLGEVGAGEGRGTTINVPLPAGATGDVALAAMDEVVTPAVEAFAPTWLLVSAGFDGHRADPLTGMGWTSGDFADLTRRVLAYAPAGKRIAFLEGGYDLDALSTSSGAFAAAMVDHDHRPEAASSGGPGRSVVDAAVAARRAV